MQGVLRRTEVFSLAGYELPGQLKCDIFGRMPALRVLILDGVEFGDRGIEQELPSLAHLAWRYGRAARFPFSLDAIKSAGVLVMRGVTCLQLLLGGLQARYGAQLLCNPWSTFGNLSALSLYLMVPRPMLQAPTKDIIESEPQYAGCYMHTMGCQKQPDTPKSKHAYRI